MVDMRPTNAKLRDRARRIVAAAGGVARDEAERLLAAAGNEVKTAIVMARTGTTPPRPAPASPAPAATCGRPWPRKRAKS